jgi:hypothetical protein
VADLLDYINKLRNRAQVSSALKHLCRIARLIIKNPDDPDPKKIFKNDDEVLVEELFVLPEAAQLLQVMGFREEQTYFYFDRQSTADLSDALAVLSRYKDDLSASELYQSQPQIQTQLQVENQPEPRPQPNPQAQPQIQSQAEPQTQPQPQPEPQIEAVPVMVRTMSKAEAERLKREEETRRIKEQMRLDRLEKQKDMEYEAIRKGGLLSSKVSFAPNQPQPSPEKKTANQPPSVDEQGQQTQTPAPRTESTPPLPAHQTSPLTQPPAATQNEPPVYSPSPVQTNSPVEPPPRSQQQPPTLTSEAPVVTASQDPPS